MTKTSRDTVTRKIQSILEQNRQLEKDLETLKAKLAGSVGNDLASRAIDVNGVKVLAAELEGVDRKALMDTADQLKNKLGRAVVVLAALEDGKVTLVAGVTKEISGKFKAGDLMREVAAEIDGKGGGRPDMAQGGGTNIEKLPAALEKVKHWVESRV
jgi:alanyl-tRNA synthetase